MLANVLLVASVIASHAPLFYTLPFGFLDSSAVAFTPQKTWLGQTLNFAQISPLVKKVNGTYGPLKGRGEAHITVITPPEFAAFSSVMTIDEVNTLALASNIQSTVFYPYCLATESAKLASGPASTYNVLVLSPGLAEIREQVQEIVVGRGGVFDAANFTPHITVAFTVRDLFEGDGVVKNYKACVTPVILN